MRAYSLILAVWLLLMPLAQAASSADILPADVRLLIDVSGSMKKTDPQNLRKPAMELMVKLLPDDSRAGIWIFGQSVEELVSHRRVDQQWREEAARKTGSITANSLFTHIGAALERASYDRGKGEARFRNNIVILTDGMVDISKDGAVNQAERQRVLKEVLPQLQEAGYLIHTIALSAEADHALMEQLSLATDGVFTTATTAEQLMQAFLRIFDQAVPRERLPLKKNRFLVDTAVEEFTALIFRKPGADPSALIAPDGQKYTGLNAPRTINWFKGSNYDLVTVAKPVAGEWQIDADVQPDTRVTVVSNLKLSVAPLKNNIEVSQSLDVKFSLMEDNARVVDEQFLQLLNIDLIVTRHRDGRQWQVPIVNSVPPIDGEYHHPLELFRESGRYDLRLLIDGKSFQREYKHQLMVGSPFTIKMTKQIEGDRVVYHLHVSTDDQRVDPVKTTIVAQEKNSAGGSQLHNFVGDGQGGWTLAMTPSVAARYSVAVQVSGWRRDGEPIKETLATQFFAFPEQDDPLPPAEAVGPQPTIASEEANTEFAETAADELSADNTDPEQSTEQENRSSSNIPWLMYASVGLANVLVLIMAFFGYRMIWGKKARDEMGEVEDTLNLDVEQLAREKKSAPAMQEVDDAGSTAIDLSNEKSADQVVAQVNDQTEPDDDFAAFLSDVDLPDESKKKSDNPS